jgi:hypothetical protein
MGLIALCSRNTDPGYSILLPNEWAIRKLERRRKREGREEVESVG